MIRDRNAQITSAVIEMRTPLARVELAASQLARDGTTPAARTLARGISEAVVELDRLIARSLCALVADVASRKLAADCRGVLTEVASRVSPVLRARRIRLQVESPASSPAPGDLEEVRHAALVLVRAGTSLAPPGGALILWVEERRGRCGVGLRVTAGGTGELLPQQGRGEAFDRLRDFAMVRGADLEIEASAACCRAMVWLGREDL